MNKLLRNNLKKIHFIKRLKNLAVKYYNLKWIEMFHKKQMQVYRETGKPFSGWMDKKERHSKSDRQNDKKIINNELKNFKN